MSDEPNERNEPTAPGAQPPDDPFGAWSRPSDQPAGWSRPAPGEQPQSSQPPAWTPPAYGAPPNYQPGAYGGQPGYGVPPNETKVGWGPAFPGAGDYLESPPRRGHGRAIIVAVVVVALALAGGGVAFFTTGGGTHHAVTDVAASQRPTPPPSRHAVPHIVPSPGPHGPTPAGPSPAGPNPRDTPAASGPLDAYLVKPSAVAPGALMLLGDGGRSTTDVATLDYCGRNYSSDSLRQTRVQVLYGVTSMLASNEFVKYQPGGAAKAYAELRQAFGSCPPSFNYPDSGGSATQVKPFSLSDVSGLVTDSLGSSEHMTLSDGTSQWNVAIYQFKGDYFSGIYTYGPDKASDEALAKKLAVLAAKHLDEAAAGKPGTGGGTFAGQGGPGQPGAQT